MPPSPLPVFNVLFINTQAPFSSLRIKKLTKNEKVKPTPTSPLQELKNKKIKPMPPFPFKNKQK
jgi:hypothetical protein